MDSWGRYFTRVKLGSEIKGTGENGCLTGKNLSGIKYLIPAHRVYEVKGMEAQVLTDQWAVKDQLASECWPGLGSAAPSLCY